MSGSAASPRPGAAAGAAAVALFAVGGALAGTPDDLGGQPAAAVTLLTTEGPFAPAGVLGFWLPVAGYAGGIGAASLSLAGRRA